jgi:anhydro-N-acetylmuramic acid kinase
MSDPTLVLGTMSGTSCDGFDVALVQIGATEESCTLLEFKSVDYTDSWKSRLSALASTPEENLPAIELEWTQWVADVIRQTLDEWVPRYGAPALLGFSGHTLYHEPGGKGTRAMGDAQWLSQSLGVLVVAEYRNADVAAGGQGAPLVPMFDAFVFGRNHRCCVNLGGIANLTLLPPAVPEVLAWDVAGCNLLLNHQAHRLGLSMDRNGAIAAEGTVDETVLSQMEDWPHLHRPAPKSLAAEDLEGLHSLLDGISDAKDALATAVEWIARALGSAVSQGAGTGKAMLTGGGALNSFLIERIRWNLPNGWTVWIPDRQWVEGKEAAAFAWLAWRTAQGLTTSLASVTGAERDVCGGRLFGNFAASGDGPDTCKQPL